MATQEWLNEHDRRQNQIRQQHIVNQNTFVKQTESIERMFPRQPAPVASAPYPIKSTDVVGADHQPGLQAGGQRGRSDDEMLVLSSVAVVAGILAGIAVCVKMLVQDGVGQWPAALTIGAMVGSAIGWILFREPLQILLGAIVFGVIVPVYKAGRWLVRLVTGRRAIKD